MTSQIDQSAIDQIIGVRSTEKKSDLPLLTNEQKAEMLQPPAPWYAKTSGQIAAVSLVVVPIGFLFYLLFSSGGTENTKIANSSTSDTEALLLKQLEDERLARQSSDRDAAFGKQDALAATPVVVQTSKPAAAAKPKPPSQQHISRAPVISRSAPPVTRTVYRSAPTVIPVRRSFAPPPPYRPTYAPPSTAFFPKEDPTQAWKRLAELGSYEGSGSGSSYVASSGITPYSPSIYTPTVYNPPQPNFIEADYTPSAGTQYPSTSPDSSYAPSSGISIPAGTEARAELATPILWAQDINITDDEFLVKLTRPLGSALPKGALVVVKTDKVSNAGLVKFKAIRATVNGQDRSLPDGIQVVATDGGFLKAAQKRPGSGFNFSDVFGVLLGGARTATSLINQPSSTTSFTSGGGFSQTVNNAQPDLLAAFGQGAAESLLNRAQSRVQQVQSNRSPYFLIGSGTQVKLIVTQSISM